MELFKNKVFRIEGMVQSYAWGGVSFLSDMLKIPNPEKKPRAEYWMGAHDSASAIMLSGTNRILLNEYIAAFPNETLGKDVQKKFGRLPYLLKILDVKDMLSIQVHPTKTDAEKEFRSENEKGTDINSPHRNYKDDNHKPELMLALGEFWLLHGFKPKEKLADILFKIPELNFLIPEFQKGYRELYATVMEMGQDLVNKKLRSLLDRILPLHQKNILEKNDENFWAARAALTFDRPGKIDRGIFSIYFFNLLNLKPGEAIFQDAGIPHAYLEGQNVEIMANSDNVLRGGLTPKHIDVKELMKHVRFEATIPQIIHEKNTSSHLGSYITPAVDFQLNKIEIDSGETAVLKLRSTNIFIVLEGKITVEENEKNRFESEKGSAWVAFDGAELSLKSDGHAIIYSASVPMPVK